MPNRSLPACVWVCLSSTCNLLYWEAGSSCLPFFCFRNNLQSLYNHGVKNGFLVGLWYTRNPSLWSYSYQQAHDSIKQILKTSNSNDVYLYLPNSLFLWNIMDAYLWSWEAEWSQQFPFTLFILPKIAFKV